MLCNSCPAARLKVGLKIFHKILLVKFDGLCFSCISYCVGMCGDGANDCGVRQQHAFLFMIILFKFIDDFTRFLSLKQFAMPTSKNTITENTSTLW